MLIRAFVAASLVMATSFTSYAQTGGESEAAQIRRQLGAYAEARSRRDAHAEATYYAQHADFRAADGTKASGREQIERALAPRSPPSPGYRFSPAINQVRFIGAGVAIVDAVASNTGNYARYVMVKRGDIWLIIAVG
jgi:uncharacterized protein (TIGR02246 family)